MNSEEGPRPENGEILVESLEEASTTIRAEFEKRLVAATGIERGLVVYAIAGFAIQQANELEGDLDDVLAATKRMQSKFGDGVTAQRILDERSGKTLGRLLKRFGKAWDLDQETEESLSQAHDVRNVLCHRFFHGRQDELNTDDGALRIGRELIDISVVLFEAALRTGGLAYGLTKVLSQMGIRGGSD